ncbi:glycosyltransferase [Mesorhizobium sp. WSM4962]|uniref:glycosyltransferase n=1 Tax=Mesorhizobium sp. WSM4962 TaxID=3038548 RepID=UPI002417EE1D|nr:glycosyltransferase [Mesorhizobium sp. WSM4962]
MIFGVYSDEAEGYSEISRDAVIEMITNSVSAGSASGFGKRSPVERQVLTPVSKTSYVKTFVAGLLFANYIIARASASNAWRLKVATRAKQFVANHFDAIDFDTLGRFARFWSVSRDVDLKASLGGLRMTLVHSAPPPDSAPVPMHTISAILLPGVFWEGNKAKWIWKIKSQSKIHVSLLLFDIVPIVVRQFSESGAAQNFAACLHYLLWSCDHFFCISSSTAFDLRRYAEACGYPSIPESKTQICKLGPARFVLDSGESGEHIRIPGMDAIAPGKFVLFVSTIESRKNHDFAYLLWRRLALKHGANLFPLVLAGKQGWDTESLMRRISHDPVIGGHHIVHLDNVSDVQLRWLYANCAFTIFPSHYEGFGMTVAESLAFGKPCVASTGSSVEEAGQGLADHLDTLDGVGWIRKIEEYMFDEDCLRKRSSFILENYKQYTWKNFTAPIIGHILAAGGIQLANEA